MESAMSARLLIPMTLVLVLAACARDSEGELRARLSNWFYLGETLYFHSKARCTAAVYRLDATMPRPSLTVHATTNRAKQAFSEKGLSAFQIAGHSPNDLTDALLLKGRGTFGKQALAAAAQAVPCFEGTRAEAQLRDALTRPGGILAYDRGSDGLMVLDPEARRVFYVAGDVW